MWLAGITIKVTLGTKIVDLSSQVVPVVIILIANLLNGHHSSLRWETVTAVFGWGVGISLLVWLIAYIFLPASSATPYTGQVAAFCLVTALSRDYEKLLKPLLPWSR